MIGSIGSHYGKYYLRGELLNGIKNMYVNILAFVRVKEWERE